jgi:hypothetical protein
MFCAFAVAGASISANSRSSRLIMSSCHCEERSDEAIQPQQRNWIAALRSQ